MGSDRSWHPLSLACTGCVGAFSSCAKEERVYPLVVKCFMLTPAHSQVQKCAQVNDVCRCAFSTVLCGAPYLLFSLLTPSPHPQACLQAGSILYVPILSHTTTDAHTPRHRTRVLPEVLEAVEYITQVRHGGCFSAFHSSPLRPWKLLLSL